jgi:hypothetical protein
MKLEATTAMRAALIRAALTGIKSMDVSEPCATKNPGLWTIWCNLKGRDPLSPSEHWTEADVVQSMEEMLNG